MKRTHSFSRWSTRWDKGLRGCICLLESIEVTAVNGFSNRGWIAWDGLFRWWYDRTSKALFYGKKEPWLNKILVGLI
ncbi:hypothetical protein [Microcoleus sp. S13_B4]|uniref:hypothetical protein n=1 Tax=Microcoleus sp. S13_B4 TaxID=3055408 RepID=UPI002FD263D2